MNNVNFYFWKKKHPKRYAIAEITSFSDMGVILYTSNRPLKTKFDLEFSDNPKYKYIEPDFS